MTASEPSRTALGVAWLRVAHQLVDAAPAILEDGAALALFGADIAEHVRESAAMLQHPGARALRTHVVLRSRFAEDRLQLAVAHGVTQYIVLGAGYDTFCVRQPAWAASLRIIEVDQAATQNDKRARLNRAGIAVPANVDFLTVDFEAESIGSALARCGVDKQQPTFFSWLGVTMYLTEPVIAAVLTTIASFPHGSEVVLTFAPVREARQDGKPTLADRAAEMGEPWLSYFTSEAMESLLRATGFHQVEFLTPLAAAAYFAGRFDGLPVPAHTSVVAAIR